MQANSIRSVDVWERAHALLTFTWTLRLHIDGFLQELLVHIFNTNLHQILKTVPLDMSSWTMVLGMSFSIILINEISKWIAKER